MSKKKQKQKSQEDLSQEFISFLPVYEKARREVFWGNLIVICLFSTLGMYFLLEPLIIGKLDLYNDCIPLFLYVLFSIIAVLAFFFMRGKDKEFRSILKKRYLENATGEFKNLTWVTKEKQQQSIIKDCTLEDSGLFSYCDIREFEDEFKGVYNGVGYKISETTLYKKIDKHFTKQIFKGVVISLNFNKKIKNRTIITSKNDKLILKNEPYYAVILTFALLCCFCAIRGMLNWFTFIIIVVLSIVVYVLTSECIIEKGAFNKITLEDCKFNRRFNVYSSDEVEARYLITPSFMERLYNLQTNFGTKKIKCSFYEKSLIIAISTKRNLFEFGSLYKPLHKTNSYKQPVKDIDSILNMVEYFKLDENTKI